MKPDRKKSQVIYRGPSVIDGGPIVASLVPESRNTTTGPMLQLFVMRADCTPLEAVQSGRDRSVCDTCPLAGGRGCYLNHGKATAGAYSRASRLDPLELDRIPAWIDWRNVRLTAYGEAYALPLPVFDAVMVNASGWTGYTHGWRLPEAQHLRPYCMASVHSAGERRAATRAGWGTFRTLLPGERPGPAEKPCPAKQRPATVRRFAHPRTTCERCFRCSGTARGTPQHIVTPIHGQPATRTAAIAAIHTHREDPTA